MAPTIPTTPEPAQAGIIDTAWRILRRRWFIVLATALVTTALVVAFSLSQVKQYTATASLLFGTASETVLGTGGYVDRNRLAATNEQLLELDIVAQATSERLRGRVDQRQVARAVSVIADPSADVVEVQATTPDPKLSADIATEYSRAFKAFRQTSAREQIEDAITLARQGLAALSREAQLGPEGEALRQQINQLQTARYAQTGGVEVVQEAAAPTEPSSPNILRNGALGLILGSVLGFSLAALRDRSDRAIRDVEELERRSGWPVLARIPNSRPLSRGSALGARSAEAEAFRMLRASLRYFSVDTELRTLLITSARSGEGKSTTSRRLADTMAAMGDEVVLIEADMHRGGQEGPVTGEEEQGLSGYLIGAPLDEVLIDVPVETADGSRSLALLPSGPLPPNPTELIESDRMHQLMEELQGRFDMVIIDSPPLPVLSDSVTLLEHVSGILVVAAVGVTTDEDIEDVFRLTSLHGRAVLGMVANFAPEADRLKGYYHGEPVKARRRGSAGSGGGLRRLMPGSNGRA